jgi:hypothetical protein
VIGERCAQPPRGAVVFLTPDRLEAGTDVAGSQLPSSGDCSPDSAIAVSAVQPASPS